MRRASLTTGPGVGKCKGRHIMTRQVRVKIIFIGGQGIQIAVLAFCIPINLHLEVPGTAIA